MPRRCPFRVPSPGAAPWSRARAVAVIAVVLAGAAPPVRGAETAADASTRALLEQLEERKMPDVALWVIDRLATDPNASADLKAEAPFRRALAIVAASRTEADSKKRSAAYDEAQKQIDQFLGTKPTGRRAIDAYTQKGNLLIQRGVMRLEQAKRPGADVAALREEAVGFFDQAIKSLEGKAKPGEDIKTVDNAEDAVVKEWREAKKKLADLKPTEPAKDDSDKRGPRKPTRRDPALDKELERLETDVEALQAKIVQTRLLVASAYFEKAKAFDENSKEWTATLEESTQQFKEVGDKYPTYGGGVLARFYEGRNLATLGKRDLAVMTLAPLAALEDKSALGVMLRAKAITTSIECWLADKKYDSFDQKMRDFALDERKFLRQLQEPDRLALKYRAAEMLKAQAGAVPPKEAARGKAMLADAGKLAMDVAKINRDFADEARALVQSLGRDVLNAADAGFEGALTEAKLAMTTMQEKQAEAKKLQADDKDATAAMAAAGAARDAALARLDEGLAKAAATEKGAEPVPEEAVNRAHYMRTFLLYDARRYAESADVGSMLVERFPNALGSRQAGAIAMASLQQVSRGGDKAAAAAARKRLDALARSIARIWPSEKEGADALNILVSNAIEAKDPRVLVELVDSLPAGSAGRAAVVGRAGATLWRSVVEQGRPEEAGRVPEATVAAWKQKARGYLDEALKAPPAAGTALKSAAAAALARAQIALDEGDAALAVKLLEAPGSGPWTIVTDPKADPTLREGSFAESALGVALRAFIQTEQLDKAQQAMNALEKLAGSGESEEKSARLTSMYTSMARQLQEQLERLGGAAADAEAREKAVAILGGFEKFLDGLAKRDPKVNSQIWVATTYLALGSGKGTGAIVPKTKAEQYLDRAADVYKKLLEKKGDSDVTRFEPSIRLKMALIYKERSRWDDAQEQIDWILSDAKRQNSLDTQVQAAEILQAAGRALAATDAAAAETKFREALVGRTGGPVEIWGWNGLAKKVQRQAFAGDDEKSLKSRDQFFAARFQQAECLLALAQLPGKSPDKAKDLLEKAQSSVAFTRKMYPDMGGPALQSRFEKLLKEIQKQQGSANPRGFAELDEQAAAAAPPAAAVAK
ncbi:MAG: hypothetical protein ACKOZU_02580 [Planctomycetaceae bacterium]